MGCSSSVASQVNLMKKRRSSKITIDTLESEITERQLDVRQRYGHPAYYKADGYEVGMRYKVKSTFQSFFVGTARLNGAKVTVKEHHTLRCNEDEVTSEIMLLSRLSHEALPKLSEIFITNISVFMVTDFIDSMRLKHYIDFNRQTTSLPLAASRSIVKAVISATSYCHSQGVILRCLTADNIMVKKVGADLYETKIADLSLAVATGSEQTLADHTLFEWNDVPYTAPEAIMNQPYTCAMDVWSIGVLLFLMVSGALPFDSTEDWELVNKIKHAAFSFSDRPEVWGVVDDKVKYLIGTMLVPSASDRPTCKEIAKNQWLLANN